MALDVSALYQHTTILSLSGSPGCTRYALVTSRANPDTDSYHAALEIGDIAGRGQPPRRLTSEGQVSSALLSPDGSRAAFIGTRPGHDGQGVYVIAIDGGEARPVQAADGLEVTMLLQWSADGRRLLALVKQAHAEDPRDDVDHPQRPHVISHLPYKLDGSGFTVGFRTHVYSIDLEGGQAQPLTSGDFDVKAAAWSPDNQRLAYAATGSGIQRHLVNLWTLDGQGQRSQITEDLAALTALAWSPDGQRLAYAANRIEGDSAAYLHLWPLGGDVQGPLCPAPLEGGDLLWHPRGDRIAAVASRNGLFQVMVVPVDGGGWQVLELGDSQVTLLAACGQQLVAVASSFCLLDEVHMLDWGSSRPSRQISHYNGELCDALGVACTRRGFDVPDGKGGCENVDAWIFRPKQKAKGELPLLVDLHGGPHSVALMDFAAHVYAYALASRGWMVVMPNTVGSSGYGEEFAARLRGRWGELDLPQIEAIVAKLQAEGLAGGFAACAGKSYGGFLSAWAIGHGKCFGAAVVSAPVADVMSHTGTSDTGFYVTPFAMGGEADEQRDRYTALSPLQYFSKVRGPVLLLNGEDDERCPRGQAEELMVRLVRLGAGPAQMVLYPGGTHSMAATGLPSHREDYHGRIVEFLELARKQADGVGETH